MSRIFILFLFSLTIVIQANAQFSPDLNSLVSPPASPEAAAFAKSGNSQISLYTGTPNISVPLASVSGRSMQVPLTLTYDASGIKVEQLATWVGLGWNLNVGGAVTRITNGLPDDYTTATPEYSPYYSTKDAAWLNHQTSTNSTRYFYQYFLDNQMDGGGNPLNEVKAYRDYMNAREAGTVDFQPDLYSFNVMGLSGTMYIDYTTGKGVCIERPDLKIDVNLMNSTQNAGFGVRDIMGWTITDSQGNKYQFNQAEVTEFDDNMDVGKLPGSRKFNSAWFCTRIETANKRDIVEFNYSTPVAWDNEQFVSGNEANIFLGTVDGECSIPPTATPTNSATYKTYQFDLQNIVINGKTRVVFEASLPTSVRQDLEGKSRLLAVNIYNWDGSALNRIELDQNYFTNGGTREYDKRLRLAGVRILGENNAGATDPDLLQEYTFKYFDQYDLPSRDSYAQDYWGYYNGKSGNSTRGTLNAGTLIPEDDDYDHSGFVGADRTPNFLHARTGTLREITYPTGGITEFHYQPHYVKAQGSTITNQSSYSTLRDHGQISLDGSEDTNDPAGVINPGCGEVDFFTVAPDMKVDIFDVPEDGNYDVRYTLWDQGGAIANKAAVVYITRGSQLSLCEVLQNIDNPDLVFFDQDDPDRPVDNPAYGPNNHFFEAGVDYYMVAISNADSIDFRVSREEFFTPSGGSSTLDNVEVGGFRAYKIVDKPDSTSVAQTRYFYYDELKHQDLKSLHDGFFAANTASSGILQVPLNYVSPATRLGLNGATGKKYSCDFVNRTAKNNYKSQPNLVTYSKVTEMVSDGTDYNGFTIYEFYNRSVATQLPYSRNHLNGRILSQSVYDEDMEILQKSESTWEGDFIGGVEGFYLKSDESGTYNFKWEQAHDGNDPIQDDYRVVYLKMGVTGTGGSTWGGTSVVGQVSQSTWVEVNIGDINSVGGAFGVDFVWGEGSSGGTLPKRCDLEPNPDVDCLRSGPQKVYYQENYAVSAAWYKKTSEKVTTYNKDGVLTAQTTYDYHDKSSGNFNVKETSAVDSKGDTFITRYTYPADLTDQVGSGNIYDSLVNLNRTAPVVKTQRVKLVDGVETVLQEQETTFKGTGQPDVIRADKMLYATNGGELIPRVQYVRYGANGNPNWVVKDDVQSIEYIWSFDGQVPLAQVSGVKNLFGSIDSDKGPPLVPSSANDFAYSSFEGNDTGGWNFTGNTTADADSPSGAHYYVLNSGSVGRTIDDDSYYTLGFWARGTQPINITGQPSITPTSEWKYYQVRIKHQSSIGLQSTGADIDELRLYIQGTQMTTYAYDEANRLITQVSPNGIPMHYEYDALGRLSKVKDHEGNIVKLMKYGFKSVMGN